MPPSSRSQFLPMRSNAKTMVPNLVLPLAADICEAFFFGAAHVPFDVPAPPLVAETRDAYIFRALQGSIFLFYFFYAVGNPLPSPGLCSSTDFSLPRMLPKKRKQAQRSIQSQKKRPAGRVRGHAIYAVSATHWALVVAISIRGLRIGKILMTPVEALPYTYPVVPTVNVRRRFLST